MFATEWTETERDPKKKKDLEEIIRHSTVVAERMLSLCDKWEREILQGMRKTSNFDSPAWSEKQASHIGDLKRIDHIRNLFSYLRGDK